MATTKHNNNRVWSGLLSLLLLPGLLVSASVFSALNLSPATDSPPVGVFDANWPKSLTAAELFNTWSTSIKPNLVKTPEILRTKGSGKIPLLVWTEPSSPKLFKSDVTGGHFTTSPTNKNILSLAVDETHNVAFYSIYDSISQTSSIMFVSLAGTATGVTSTTLVGGLSFGGITQGAVTSICLQSNGTATLLYFALSGEIRSIPIVWTGNVPAFTMNQVQIQGSSPVLAVSLKGEEAVVDLVAGPSAVLFYLITSTQTGNHRSIWRVSVTGTNNVLMYKNTLTTAATAKNVANMGNQTAFITSPTSLFITPQPLSDAATPNNRMAYADGWIYFAVPTSASPAGTAGAVFRILVTTTPVVSEKYQSTTLVTTTDLVAYPVFTADDATVVKNAAPYGNAFSVTFPAALAVQTGSASVCTLPVAPVASTLPTISLKVQPYLGTALSFKEAGGVMQVSVAVNAHTQAYGELTVFVNVGGTATLNVDYSVSSSLQFDFAGQTTGGALTAQTKVFWIVGLDDNLNEGLETITLSVGCCRNCFLGTSGISFPGAYTVDVLDDVFDALLQCPTWTGLDGCNVVQGSTTITNTSSTGLNIYTSLKYAVSSLSIINNPTLDSLQAMAGLQQVGATLSVSNNPMLKLLDGLHQIKLVGGDVQLNQMTGLTDLTGFFGLSTISGSFFINKNPAMVTLNGGSALDHIAGNLVINDMTSLTGVDGLALLREVTGDIIITSSPKLALLTLAKLTTIGGSLTLTGLSALYNISLPSLTRAGQININGCFNLKGLSMPKLQTVGSLSLKGLRITSLSGLASLRQVTGSLVIEDTTVNSLDGMLPGGSVGSIVIANNSLLQEINAFVGVTSLTGSFTAKDNPVLVNLDGLMYLKTVGGNVTLTNNAALSLAHWCSLTSIAGTVTLARCPLVDCASFRSVFLQSSSWAPQDCISSPAPTVSPFVRDGTSVAFSGFTCTDNRPSPPTHLSGIPFDGTADVSFKPPLYRGNKDLPHNITAYAVLPTPKALAASGKTTTIRVSQLTLGFTYYFTATATNALGFTSSQSYRSPEILISVTGAAYTPVLRSMVVGSDQAFIPVLTGVKPFTFTISPPLPDSMTIDVSTGRVHGVTPFNVPDTNPITEYTVKMVSQPPAGSASTSPVVVYTRLGMEIVGLQQFFETTTDMEFDVYYKTTVSSSSSSSVSGNATFQAPQPNTPPYDGFAYEIFAAQMESILGLDMGLTATAVSEFRAAKANNSATFTLSTFSEASVLKILGGVTKAELLATGQYYPTINSIGKQLGKVTVTSASLHQYGWVVKCYVEHPRISRELLYDFTDTMATDVMPNFIFNRYSSTGIDNAVWIVAIIAGVAIILVLGLVIVRKCMFNRQQRQIQAAKINEKDKVNAKPVPVKKSFY